MALVYTATNLINGKRYVGVTSQTLKRRVAGHRFYARKMSPTALHRAMRKYGEDQFRWSIVKQCETFDDALSTEMRLISLWSPEYNMTSGGEGLIGVKHSEESKNNMRLSHVGKPNKLKGIPRPPGVIEKMVSTRKARGHYGNQRKGTKTPIHIVEKMMATKVKLGQFGLLGKLTSKSVRCLNDGSIFISATKAAEFYGIGRKSVTRVCNGCWNKANLNFEWVDDSLREAAGLRKKPMSKSEMTEMLRLRVKTFPKRISKFTGVEVRQQ